MSNPIRSNSLPLGVCSLAMASLLGLADLAQAQPATVSKTDSLPSLLKKKDSARIDLPAPSNRLAPADTASHYTGNPRILVLDPELGEGDLQEANDFAKWLTTTLRKDGRAIPYRPTVAETAESWQRTICAEVSCANRWKRSIPLEEVWFTRVDRPAIGDGIRVRVGVLDRRDSVRILVHFVSANGDWKARASKAIVNAILSGRQESVTRGDNILVWLSSEDSAEINRLGSVVFHQDRQHGFLTRTTGFLGALGGLSFLAGGFLSVGNSMGCIGLGGEGESGSCSSSRGASTLMLGGVGLGMAALFTGLEAGSVRQSLDSSRTRLDSISRANRLKIPASTQIAAQDPLLAPSSRETASTLPDAKQVHNNRNSDSISEENPTFAKVVAPQPVAENLFQRIPMEQQIAQKEVQYRDRVYTGQVISAVGLFAVGSGAVMGLVNAVLCVPEGLYVGSSDGSSEERQREAKEKADAEARGKACQERTIAAPLMIAGGGVLIAGVATLISSRTFSEELRDLKKRAAASGVSVAPYVHSASGNPGVLAQVRF